MLFYGKEWRKNNAFYVFIYIVFIIEILFVSSDSFVDKETQPKIYGFILFSLIAGIAVILNQKKVRIKIDLLSIIFVLFLSYLFVCNQFAFPLGVNSAILISCLFLYIFFRYVSHESPLLSIFNILIVVFCAIQALYGISQYFGMLLSAYSFPIVGSFDNPAGFAACLSVGFPFGLFLLKHSGWKRYLVVVSLFIISASIVLSESRSGIITIICSIVLFLCYKYSAILNRWRKIIIPALVALFIIVIVSLFLFKKNSALGRLLIWQVSADMIQEKPVFGKAGTFKSEYMPYQAEYFERNPDSEYLLLADNVVHTFNEYLYLTLEYGLIGLILFLSVIIIAVKYNRKGLSPYLLSIISILVFSFFSYPFRYPFVWLILIYSLSQLAIKAPVIFTLRENTVDIFRIIVTGGIALCSYIFIKDFRFEYRWKKISHHALFGKTEKVLPTYEQLYQNWNGNPLFIYNYGAELNHVKRYDESIKVFRNCEKYFNDYDVQMLLADNYFNLEDWNSAEQHYITASNMCPNRFIPLHQLSKLYEKTNDILKLEKVIRTILEKPVKVKSPTVARIITEANKIQEKIITREEPT